MAKLSSSQLNIIGLTGPIEHGDRPQPGRERLRSGMRTKRHFAALAPMSALTDLLSVLFLARQRVQLGADLQHRNI